MKPFRSKFVMTVPDGLYQSTCAEVSEDFAGSYLPGAKLDGPNLHPRTLIGWKKMVENRDFMALMKRNKMIVVKPTPYPGDGDRMSTADLAPGESFTPRRPHRP